HPKLNVDLKRLVSFTEKARSAGLAPETRVSSFRAVQLQRVRLVPASEVAAVLELDDRSQVYEMERIRSLDTAPVIYERRVLRADLCPGLGRGDLSGSLYSLFHDRFCLRLEGVAQRIRARNLVAEHARMLDVHEGTAVLELAGVGYLTDGTPLWYEETLYRGDTYEFVNAVRATGEGPQSTLDPRTPDTHLWYRWNQGEPSGTTDSSM
ncbi:MAG: GntR family transcriptional regulator, partial [Spirochaetota bacterium]